MSACVGATGKDGSSCTVHGNPDGSKTLACPDGSSVTISDGDPGPQGVPGKDGQPGRDGVDGRVGINGRNGADGNDGMSPPAALVRTTTFEQSQRCPAGGGVRVETGVDNGTGSDGEGLAFAGNGQLDDGEVQAEKTVEVCNGRNSLLEQSTLTPGESCALGGTRISGGLDDNGDKRLDADEVDFYTDMCRVGSSGDGVPLMVRTAVEPAGGLCGQPGGIVVAFGYDKDDNARLDVGEEESSHAVCHGTEGPKGSVGSTGPDGASALVNEQPRDWMDGCDGPGRIISFGVDTDRDGQLDPVEVRASVSLCGRDGSTGGQTGTTTITGTSTNTGTGTRTDVSTDTDIGTDTPTDTDTGIGTGTGTQGGTGTDSGTQTGTTTGTGSGTSTGVDGVCDGELVAVALESPTVAIPSTSTRCNSTTGYKTTGDLVASTIPICGGKTEVSSLTLRYRMDNFFGEPTCYAVLAWEGAGSIGSLKWLAEVQDRNGNQYVTDGGRRVYASWLAGSIKGPGAGFGTDSTGSPDWAQTFVVYDEATGTTYGVTAAEAKRIYRNCFTLANLSILALNKVPTRWDGGRVDGGQAGNTKTATVSNPDGSSEIPR